MQKICDIINDRVIIGPDEYLPKIRKASEITVPLPSTPSGRVDLEFEIKVFNHFLEHKDTLGISKIYRLRSSSADGILELDDGNYLLLEIKYALGWEKCCQARIQFQRFLIEAHSKLHFEKPKNAMIVFHHFSGDFARIRKGREGGWVLFYEEENALKNSLIKTDIIRLTDYGQFITYPEENV